MIRSNTSHPTALPPDVLLERAALRAGADPETGRRVIQAFLEVCRESLLEGQRVDLGGLVDLGVVVEPARIRRDPTGRFSEIAPARSRLDVQVGGDLRERLATRRPAAILLAMPGSGTFGEMLGEHFEKLGWHVERVGSTEDCRARLQDAQPYLMVCDHKLPGRDDFVREVKSTWRTNAVPMVTLHTRYEDLQHPEGLLVLGDLAVFEPISVHPFLRAMDQVLAQASEESAVFERQLHYRVPVREEEILRALSLGEAFFHDAGFRGDALVALTTAFREAVRNAEIHGSRGDASCSIDLELLLDREKITVVVQDEGDGFDHVAHIARLREGGAVAMARQRHAAGGVGGLGIYLMLRCSDRVAFDEKGARVTLTRYRPGREG